MYSTDHKTIVKTMVEVWALHGECSDLHAHCMSSDLNMCTTNVVTIHVPAVKTAGRNVGAE